MNKFLLGASSLLLILTSGYASATVTDTVLGSNFVNGQTVYTETFADGFTASFTGSRAFEKKTQDSVTGVGISGGRTDGEIDIGETLTGNFSSNVIVNSINVGLLFDGPEYSDVQEVAKLTVNFANGTQSSFTLTATGTHTAIWTGSGSVLSIGSGAIDGGTGEWAISNPFGTNAISSIQFTAAPGIAKQSCHSCNNQSDYTFVSMSVTPVPETDTRAMILGGLLLLGGISMRRSKV